MKNTTRDIMLSWAISAIALTSTGAAFAHNDTHAHYNASSQWVSLADGTHAIGSSHGEIDVAKDGTFYLSVMGNENNTGGIKKYSPSGELIGSVANAPKDLHSMVIVSDTEGQEHIFAAGVRSHHIIKMTLDGEILIKIDGLKAIPSKYHQDKINKKNNKPFPKLKLSGMAVDSQGNWYVADGYGLDYIHKFDPTGKYLTTFGGREAPYGFKNCHKIHIDPRFSPNRLMCTDRKNGRIVHMTLDGDVIGDYATNLRRPSAVDFHGDIAAVAEISGRVSLINKDGTTISTLGTNDRSKEINTNKTPPTLWKAGVFTAPHGITFDEHGNLFITEWNKWGRIVRYDLNQK